MEIIIALGHFPSIKKNISDLRVEMAGEVWAQQPPWECGDVKRSGQSGLISYAGLYKQLGVTSDYFPKMIQRIRVKYSSLERPGKTLILLNKKPKGQLYKGYYFIVVDSWLLTM